MFQETELKQEKFKSIFYYKKHREFCGLATHKTIDLKRNSAALKKLSIRWAEDRTASSINNELPELTGLIACLRDISSSFQSMSGWVSELEDESSNALCFSRKNVELNDLLLDWMVLVNLEEQAFQNFLLVAISLRKAVKLLNTDLQSPGIKIDTCMHRFVSRRILIASAMVKESSNTARVAANLIQSNEGRWRDIDQKIKQWV